jgi:hypothetical protein
LELEAEATDLRQEAEDLIQASQPEKDMTKNGEVL